MKRLVEGKVSLVAAVVITLALIAGLVAWQAASKDNRTVMTPVEKRCGSDRQCFQEAYDRDCGLTTIRTTRDDEAGGQVTTVGRLLYTQYDCIIEVTVASNPASELDGDYDCYTLETVDDALVASECVGSSDLSEIVI